MLEKEIIEKTKKYVKNMLKSDSSGHDWFHMYRVWQTALHIAQEEENDVDLFVVEMAALLHDVADPKLHSKDALKGQKIIKDYLNNRNIPQKKKDEIFHIVKNSSFSKTLEQKKIQKSKEFMIVQDADRLDALGAIGIARAFRYGGHMKRVMHDPKILPNKKVSSEQYLSREGTTINHFYEKLLLLKDKMNTKTAKKLAQERHQFMEQFLDQFFKEWENKL